ncbi:Helix-turn-helix [Meinhardsimonia xiamenensis]|jgi:transcriptional regulator with XRE-family HTH domain|uniref:Helix-turn-helix n=1 Tax=Meinhardsimonia xiamenensis TaxID=990712 RepID=A0A1G9FKN8_9RHOB|nr:helix-turn-helix protein [Meinhardsimonia xiamenensis]SDK88988.1 Helix-turn-helix [Meinhardsimonia xiamenensis]
MMGDNESGHGDWYSNDIATFGDRLAAAREAAGLTQAELARRLGVKLKTLQRWENDLAEPRANKLQMLAGLLNVSIIWLLTGEGEGVTPPGDDSAAMPEDLPDLLAEIRSLRAELSRTAERLGRAEKRLRAALQVRN